ncbi:MAG: type II toxin-antitoxin system Phd/YefM family antitoxin [Deltaproteobacteria bacterium]|nr:type II toxin-antitoxin system Phd/YefM family antitoxin [Deltaproteobacteria bacterium]
MKQYSVHAAKTQLSRLIAEAEAGDDVVIARGDKPAVRLVVVHPVPLPVFGAMKGRASVSPVFFDPLPDDELAPWSQ